MAQTYDVNKPTFAYTEATTQFDDELIRRGIITKEQAIIRKGASVSEARRIIHEASQQRKQQLSLASSISSSEEEEEDDEADREAMLQYQQRRLQDYKQDIIYGEVISISRSDWTREVNNVVKDWVVVNLTCEGNIASASHWNECKKIEDAMHRLAKRFPHIKFVSIPSTSAIENWPSDNLPTVFLYKDGSMQHQLIGLQDLGGMSDDRLEWILAKSYGILHTSLPQEPPKSVQDKYHFNARGMVGSLATFAESSDQTDVL